MLWAVDLLDHEVALGMEVARAEQGRTDQVCLAAPLGSTPALSAGLQAHTREK